MQVVSPKPIDIALESEVAPPPEPRSLGVYVIAAGAAVTLGWVGALLYGATVLVGHVIGGL